MKNQHNSKKTIKSLETNLKKSIFGQDAAIERLVDYITISYAGLNDKEKPIGSFLFTGPTGVGKTELAKELAKQLGMNFERFDMSEYATERSSDNFIGGAAGLVGYENGGLLTNAIIANPHSVVLFDEIEKAHKQVLNKLLQVMDYGVLTSSKGEKAYFQDTIIIFTSNLGAIKTTKRTVGFGSSTYVETENDMDEFLSPEFKGRINQVIEFSLINDEISKLIIKKSFNKINEILKGKKITVEPTQNLIDRLAEKRDARLGARNLNNIITLSIKTIVAKELILNKITLSTKFLFDWDNEKNDYTYVIRKQETNLNLEYLNYYENCQEAYAYARVHHGVVVTRSPCGKGFIVK